MSGANKVENGFFERHSKSAQRSVELVPLAHGFLKLEYDLEGEQPLLMKVSLVAMPSAHAPSIGCALEFQYDGLYRARQVTFIEENAVSGTQWSDGRVAWGTTYDDVPSSERARDVALSRWVDERIAEMINPTGDDRAELLATFDLQKSLAAIKADRGDARDHLWRRSCPRTEEEVAIVLSLVEDDEDLTFVCAEPLKRAQAGVPLLLDRVTALAKTRDDSELREILEEHAASASAANAADWLALCEGAWKRHGLDALGDGEQGALFRALARAPHDSPERRALFEAVTRRIAEGTDLDRSSYSFVGDALAAALKR